MSETAHARDPAGEVPEDEATSSEHESAKDDVGVAVTAATEPTTGEPERPAEEQSPDQTSDRESDQESEQPDRGGWRHRVFGSTPFLILVALFVAILVKTFVIQAFYIPSESMVPTLEVGDRVFVSKFMFDGGDVARGDVIVFENPHPGEVPDRSVIGGFFHWLGEGIGLAQPENEDFIKRVIALPGETIEIKDNVVYIDGKPLDEPYLTEAAKRATGTLDPQTVPNDAAFVMGDNRGNSADSRFGLGTVPLDKVIGKAFVVIWPPADMGGID